MTATADAFRLKLREIFKIADNIGLVAIEVKSGNLHRNVGGYPGTNHRMPVCCEVMRQEMGIKDSIVASPESGQGASLIVRYTIPRT